VVETVCRAAVVRPTEPDTGDGANGLDAKLLGALERAGHALDAELRRQARAENVTPTQARLLLRLSAEPVERRRVGALAVEFDIRQPTVSDAVAALERKDLLSRRRDRRDARAVDLELTPRGREVATRISSWDRRVRASLAGLAQRPKEVALTLLLDLLGDLNEEGVIAEARMCTTCRFFRRNRNSPPYCRLLEIPLKPPDLRIDCPDHQHHRAAA
jgi:DNA-binding MarR family transcriptional regulator